MTGPLVTAPNPDVPLPPAVLPATPSLDERLARIEALLAELVDIAPRVAYSARQAGAQLGDTSESFVRRLVRDGVIAKVPHLGTRVVIAHHELVRAAERLADAERRRAS